jgi:hypothetical protein
VLSLADWVAYGTDAWACALGVPQEQARQPHRIDALRWPSRSGRSLGYFDFSAQNPDNPSDDPWPIDRVFDFKPYQPWTTAQAYSHTLVTGNGGQVCIADVTAGVDGDPARLVQEIAFTRPQAWFKGQAKAKLMIYVHGGLNCEAEAVDRIRVLAPCFEANGIDPPFLTWHTGPLETQLAMPEGKFRSFFGASTAEEMRAAGILDELGEALDRRVEELARKVPTGVWSEMRDNAALGATADHGLTLLAQSLARLRDAMKGQGLEVHLVGHSAGASCWVICSGNSPHLRTPPHRWRWPVARFTPRAARCPLPSTSTSARQRRSSPAPTSGCTTCASASRRTIAWPA